MTIETALIIGGLAIGGGTAAAAHLGKPDRDRTPALIDAEPLEIETQQLAKDSEAARRRRVSRSSLRVDVEETQGLRIPV